MIEFDDVFRFVTGYSKNPVKDPKKSKTPFSHQSELAELIQMGLWPTWLDWNTGTGKTLGVFLAWYYSLYCDCFRKKRLTPLRLHYAIERISVVNQAYYVSLQLLEALQHEPKLKVMADTICQRFDCHTPLLLSRVHGNVAPADRQGWMKNVNIPAITINTVSQLGAKLGFRPYAVSCWKAPLYAGLSAADSAIVIDEAHLFPQFIQFCRHVQGSVNLDLPSKMLCMTATLPHGAESVGIQLDPKVQKQLKVPRRIAYSLAVKNDVAGTLAAEAKAMQKKHDRVAVICNTVPCARKVFKSLQKANKGKDRKIFLLTSQIRAYERDNIEKQIRHIEAEHDRTGEKITVVATQVIEAGSDLDFDAMVTESAPFDCLKQRFGRLDRLGKYGKSEGVIVYRDDQSKNFYSEEETEKKTIEWLLEHHPDGVANFNSLVAPEGTLAVQKATVNIPAALQKQLACTSRKVDVDLNVYIHGRDDRERHEIQLCWRAEVPKHCDCKELVDRPASPYVHELLTLERREFSKGKFKFACIIQENRSFYVMPFREAINEAPSGSVIFIPPEAGLHDQDSFDITCKKAFRDVFDLGKSRLRLHPRIFPSFRLSDFFDGKTLDRESLQGVATTFKSTKSLYPGVRDKLKRLAETDDWTAKIEKESLIIRFVKEEYRKRKEPIGLGQHLRDVCAAVRKAAEAIGLSEHLIKILCLAAMYHDLGKADPRFQKTLHHPYDGENLIASSIRSGNNPYYGRPREWRHECQSVAIMIDNGLSGPDDDLIKFLILSHHGYNLPWPDQIKDEKFEAFNMPGHLFSDNFARRAESPYTKYLQTLFKITLKVWEKGVWDATFLSSCLRLADQQMSSKR